MLHLGLAGKACGCLFLECLKQSLQLSAMKSGLSYCSFVDANTLGVCGEHAHLDSFGNFLFACFFFLVQLRMQMRVAPPIPLRLCSPRLLCTSKVAWSWQSGLRVCLQIPVPDSGISIPTPPSMSFHARVCLRQVNHLHRHRGPSDLAIRLQSVIVQGDDGVRFGGGSHNNC